MPKPTSVRLEEDVLARLDRLGELYERSRGWLISEAVRRYLAEEEDFVAKVQQGEADVAAGRVIPHEQVMREMDELIASFEHKKAAE